MMKIFQALGEKTYWLADFAGTCRTTRQRNHNKMIFMKANIPTSIEGVPEVEDGGGFDETPVLRGFLVYEDLDTGLRIKRAIEHVMSHLEPKVEIDLNAWRFDLLGEPRLRMQAAKETVRCDIFMLSAHGKSQLPPETNSCLMQWLEQRMHDRPRALVVSLDSDAKGSEQGREILTRLRSTSGQSGVEMFAHFDSIPNADSELTMERIWQRENATTEVLENILHKSVQPPRCGASERNGSRAADGKQSP